MCYQEILERVKEDGEKTTRAMAPLLEEGERLERRFYSLVSVVFGKGDQRYRYNVPRDQNWLHIEKQVAESPGLAIQLYSEAIKAYEKALRAV